MPPKKAIASQGDGKAKKIELSQQVLQHLLNQHRIIFEGPVPEKEFPCRYKHLFRTIRRYHVMCYKDQKQNLTNSQKERVRKIRFQAKRLRENVKVDELEWRDAIENQLMCLFREEIVCYRCQGERWRSDLEALPFETEQQLELQERRAARKPCRCNHYDIRPTPEGDDSDDDGQTQIFETAIGAATCHGPNDDLDAYSISMAPDRVVGLHLSDRYKRYVNAAPAQMTHTCMKDKESLLYPFLVLEAKRERDAPGFRSIGQQTAFPIRRMLQTQQSLLRKAAESVLDASKNPIDPLVWFLCNQGELWRLYAAVIDGPDILVFDLWLNNVESKDGAFQLIKIVDFIWTWARDVYRPQIRSCLRSFYTDRREMSPTSTDPIGRSQSVASVTNSQITHLQPLDAIIEDDVLLEVVDAANSIRALQFNQSNLVLRLAQSSGLFTPWAARTSIRSSDVSSCSCQVFKIPSRADLFSDDDLRPLWQDTDIMPTIIHLLINLHGHCLLLTRHQVQLLLRYWTAGDGADHRDLPSADAGEVVQAILLFKTSCQPGQWQITRQLSAIVFRSEEFKYLLSFYGSHDSWDDEALSGTLGTPSNDDFKAVLHQIQKVRNLSGSSSVMHAFRGTRAILTRRPEERERVGSLKWATPSEVKSHTDSVRQAFNFFEVLNRSKNKSPRLHSTTTRLLQVTKHGHTPNCRKGPFAISADVGASGAVIGIRPTTWPVQCPKFCLFILGGLEQHDKASLAKVLEDTVDIRDFYPAGEGPFTMDQSDKNLLRAWVKAMKE